MKIIKVIALIPVLLIVFLAFALLSIDPNDYKQHIIDAAKQRIGMNINIAGDLSWSFWPLGISVNALRIDDQSNQLFTEIDSVQLAVDTFSLLRFAPEVNGVYASGALLQLKTDKEGFNNWESLLATPTQKAAVSNNSRLNPDPVSIASFDQEYARVNDQFEHGTNYEFVRVSNQTVSVPAEASDASAIVFVPARHVHLRNFQVRYDNEIADLSIDVSDIEAELKDVSLEKPFSVHLRYSLSSETPKVSYQHQLSTKVTLLDQLKHIRLGDIVNTVDTTTHFGPNKPLQLSLTGAVDYFAKEQKLEAKNIQLSGAGLALDTNFTAIFSGEYPHLSGKMDLAPFALSALSQNLGLKLGVNDSALQQISFKTPFELKRNQVRLPTFDLNVDSSNFIGRVKYHLTNKQLDLSVKGDKLNVDSYLTAFSGPDPANHQRAVLVNLPSLRSLGRSTHSTIAAIDSPAPNAETASLLPIDLLNQFEAVINLKQEALSYQGIDASNIDIAIDLGDGALRLSNASGELFEGNVRTDGIVRLTTNPSWSFEGDISNINIQRAIESQAIELPVIASGLLNSQYNIDATGNSVPELLKTNRGTLSFGLSDGALAPVNLDQYLCEGFALINRKSLNTTWAEETLFSSLTGQNELLNGVLKTTSINIETDTLKAYGNGQFNLLDKQFRYALAVKPMSGNAGHACEINEKFQHLEIPLACSGVVSEPPMVNCALDSQRINNMLTQLAKSEAKRKTEKELDRAIDKKLDKYIDKDSELGKQLKKGLLNIFN